MGGTGCKLGAAIPPSQGPTRRDTWEKSILLEKSTLPTSSRCKRLGEPEEIGRCVVFLASDDAGLITGSTLTANGGQYIT